MIEKTMKYIIYASIAVLFTIPAGFAYLLYPRTIIEPQKQPYEVVNKKVSVKSDLIYIADICKYYDITGEVSRRFVYDDGTSYTFDKNTSSIASGCRKTPVAVPLPDFLSPGRGHLEIDIDYKITILQRKVYHLRTEEVEITK